MSGKEGYDDDYIARLLVEDAKNFSIRHASSFTSRSNALRPNTRFLHNIIREADNHNSSLRSREQSEARTRLRRLHEEGNTLRQVEGDEDRRSSKRRRTDRDSNHTRRKHHKRRYEHTDDDQTIRDRRHDMDSQEDDQKSRRSLLPESNRDSSRSKSTRASTEESDGKHRLDRSHMIQNHEGWHRRSRERNSEHRTLSSSRSDILDDNVGDEVGVYESQPRIRGRGAGTIRSHIEEHFSADYDPKQDTGLNEEPLSDGDDWEMALEVVRDRAMWKQKQADRLREAGWDDDQIKKWERGRLNKSELDLEHRTVEWTKKGETRAWDVGKAHTSKA